MDLDNMDDIDHREMTLVLRKTKRENEEVEEEEEFHEDRKMMMIKKTKNEDDEKNEHDMWLPINNDNDLEICKMKIWNHVRKGLGCTGRDCIGNKKYERLNMRKECWYYFHILYYHCYDLYETIGNKKTKCEIYPPYCDVNDVSYICLERDHNQDTKYYRGDAMLIDLDNTEHVLNIHFNADFEPMTFNKTSIPEEHLNYNNPRPISYNEYYIFMIEMPDSLIEKINFDKQRTITYKAPTNINNLYGTLRLYKHDMYEHVLKLIDLGFYIEKTDKTLDSLDREQMATITGSYMNLGEFQIIEKLFFKGLIICDDKNKEFLRMIIKKTIYSGNKKNIVYMLNRYCSVDDFFRETVMEEMLLKK